jgi:8-oxo-dGTP pyrophosphatase MutT (NUDIX family)
MAHLYDTEIVLVREFRSPGRTAPGGFVYDLPGGSSKDGWTDPRDLAVSEVAEETGFKIDPSRLKCLGTLQLAATLCAHASTLYIAKLSAAEMDNLKATAALGEPLGVTDDTERTYVEVRTIGDLMKNDLVDWSTFGMIMAAILNDSP